MILPKIRQVSGSPMGVPHIFRARAACGQRFSSLALRAHRVSREVAPEVARSRHAPPWIEVVNGRSKGRRGEPFETG